LTQTEFNTKIVELRPRLWKFALSLTNDSEKAADLVQASYLKALVYQSQYQDNTNILAWMFTIVKNTFINNYREQKMKGAILDYSPELHKLNFFSDKGDMSPESAYQEAEILEIMKQVPPTHLVPFELHLAGYKYKEIAEKLNINVGTVKSRIFFARKAIMDILNNDKLVNFKTSNTMGKKVLADDINDVAKDCMVNRLNKALVDEKLGKGEAARMLGFTAGANMYLSFVTNKKFWDKCPAHVWNTLQKWCNSGLSIKKYALTLLSEGAKSISEKPAKEEPVENLPDNQTKSKKELIDDKVSQKGSEPETLPKQAERYPLTNLAALTGNGKFIPIENMTLDEAIAEVKNSESALYYPDNAGITLCQIKKLYSIKVEPVEKHY
jgi:RNA polymerase sigma factor (sigma-70 family)